MPYRAAMPFLTIIDAHFAVFAKRAKFVRSPSSKQTIEIRDERKNGLRITSAARCYHGGFVYENFSAGGAPGSGVEAFTGSGS